MDTRRDPSVGHHFPGLAQAVFGFSGGDFGAVDDGILCVRSAFFDLLLRGQRTRDNCHEGDRTHDLADSVHASSPDERNPVRGPYARERRPLSSPTTNKTI